MMGSYRDTDSATDIGLVMGGIAIAIMAAMVAMATVTQFFAGIKHTQDQVDAICQKIQCAEPTPD